MRVVVTRSNQRGVQALYRLRSARQRLAIVLPADAEFEAQPARINGKPVALERGDQGQLFVPLSGQDPNTPFALELRYSVPGDHQRISIPEFPEDPAVQKVYAAVYFPNELALVRAMRSKGRTFSFIQEEIGVCRDVIRPELVAGGYSTAPVKSKRRAKRGAGFWRSFD